MRKLIICDKNPKLIKAVKKLIKEYGYGCFDSVRVIEGDVIKVHEKNPGSRIVTASNPSFSPDGGLDAVLAKTYNWNPVEFSFDDHLFYAVSVDTIRSSTKDILLRAAVGILGYSSTFTPILTGMGTGVGGLEITVFIEVLGAILSNLRSANLRSADLSSANLRSANLRSANLSSANLRSANLSSANLSFANLSSADLSFANLRSADLSFANLSSANLRSAKNPPYQWHSSLSILKFQTGKLRAYKYVNEDGTSPINAGLTYVVGQTITEDDYDSDDMTDCSRGINVATLEWCERERESRPIIELEFNAKDIVSIPYISDGKFRVRKCKVLRRLSDEQVRKLIAKTRSYSIEGEDK